MTIKSKDRSIKLHKCDEIHCPDCKGWFLEEHNCYMKKKLVK